MAKGPRYRVAFRRRREGKTDYRYRAKLLRSGLPRAVVRSSLRNMTIQLVQYNEGSDIILVSATSGELSRYDWKQSRSNISAAYLTGFLAGKRALKKGINGAVLDIGLKMPTKGAKVFASLKGMLDAGLNIPHDKKILSTQERIEGAHISDEVKNKFKETKVKIEEAW